MLTAATTRARRVLSSVNIVPLLGALLVVFVPAGAGAGNGDAPKPPTSVMVAAASPSTLAVSWDASRPRAGREIVRYDLFVDGASAGTTAGLSYEFASLECARVYTLGVEAVDTAGSRSPRASVTASTAACLAPAPAAGEPAPSDPAPTPSPAPDPGAATSSTGSQPLTFATVADARVHEAYSSSNYGSSSSLRVDGGADPDVETYLRFDVTGLSAPVSSAKLRVYTTSSGTRPSVSATSNAWLERGITWSNRPARGTAVPNTAGSVSSSSWVEWDVTGLVSTNGAVSFILATSSSDGVNMVSREGGNAAQLVLGTGASSGDVTAPSAPSGVAIATVDATTVNVVWTASTDDTGVAGYAVYRDGQKLGTTTTTAYTSGGLSCGRTYAFDVEAFDAAGNASARSRASFSTGACPPQDTSSCTRFAAPTGSDTAAGTIADPYRTAQKLSSSLSSGQTGCLRGGSYAVSSGFVLDIAKSGTTIQSYPGERAKLVGNIQVKNVAAGTRLANLDIEGIGGSNSVKIYAADVVVEGNDITNAGRGQSCMMLGSNSGYGQAARIVIRRNRFHECGSALNDNKDHAIYASNVIDGQITHNVFWNSAAYAIQLYPNAQRTRFAHNVIDGDAPSVRGGVLFGGDGSYKSNDNLVEYNVIAYAVTYNISSTWGGYTPGTGNIARNNCVWAGKLGDVHMSKGGFTAAGNLVADPLFLNRTARNYGLGTSSGCGTLVGTVGN